MVTRDELEALHCLSFPAFCIRPFDAVWTVTVCTFGSFVAQCRCYWARSLHLQSARSLRRFVCSAVSPCSHCVVAVDPPVVAAAGDGDEDADGDCCVIAEVWMTAWDVPSTDCRRWLAWTLIVVVVVWGADDWKIQLWCWRRVDWWMTVGDLVWLLVIFGFVVDSRVALDLVVALEIAYKIVSCFRKKV